MARRGAPAYRQRGRSLGREIGEGDRIAVDGGIVVRRHVARRGDGLGQNAPARVLERHRLHRRQRSHGGADALQRRRGRQQRGAEGEAVIAELRHRRSRAGNGR